MPLARNESYRYELSEKKGINALFFNTGVSTLSRRMAGHEYRDRIYIRKDIMLKLFEYGELNQSKLISYCGLNNAKHKAIINDMVDKGLVTRAEESWGAKMIIKYKMSEKGRAILREVLGPYEALFPRISERKTAIPRISKPHLLPLQKLSSVAVP